MGIKIKGIVAEDCGPIRKFNQEFGDLNLIYGKNEQGKSFLVEFIIRCLFNNRKPWGYLRETGKGKVTVTGLEEKSIDFKPEKHVKLENFFEKDPRGLPSALLKLLVVKEGETKITQDEAGIDKDSIKDLLSSRRILDAIDNKIKPTVKQAIINNDIIIDRKGTGKDYYNKLEQLQKIDECISRLNSESKQGVIKDLKLKDEKLKQHKEKILRARRYKAYVLSQEAQKLDNELSGIPEQNIARLNELIKNYNKDLQLRESLIKELEEISEDTKTLTDLEGKINLLIKAKRHTAYLIAGEIKEIEKKLSKLPEEELNRLENNISKYNDKRNELFSRRELAKEYHEKSTDYNWLKSAKENYLKFLSTTETSRKPSTFVFALALTVFAAGIGTLLFNQKITGLLLITIGFASFIYYFFQFRKSVTNFRLNREFEGICTEFRNRFGKELKNISLLETILNEQEKYHNKLELYQSELKTLETEYNNYQQNIHDAFNRLKGFIPEEKEWNRYLSDLKQERSSLIEKKLELKEKFTGLEIDENQFEVQDPGIDFDKNKLAEAEKQHAGLYELKKQVYKKELEKKKIEERIIKAGDEIRTILKSMTSEEVTEEAWEKRLQELMNKRKLLSQRIVNIRGQLEGLGVDEKAYEINNPGIEYSQTDFEILEKEIQLNIEALQKEEERLRSLEKELISVTGAETSTGWSELIDLLYRKKEEVIQDIQDIKADILAGRLLHDAVTELQQEEDTKITEVLNSPEFSSLLYELTGRYKRLSFNDSGIIISDDSNDFYLKDLSTGAREQVMITLRIGFLKRLLKQDSAFLIFDDAFQHSDYDRRRLLVNSISKLAGSGWQIIYFTMDDHIRSLFENDQRSTLIEI